MDLSHGQGHQGLECHPPPLRVGVGQSQEVGAIEVLPGVQGLSEGAHLRILTKKIVVSYVAKNISFLTLSKYLRRVDLPAPTLPSTEMVKGLPEGLDSNSLAEGNWMK